MQSILLERSDATRARKKIIGNQLQTSRRGGRGTRHKQHCKESFFFLCCLISLNCWTVSPHHFTLWPDFCPSWRRVRRWVEPIHREFMWQSLLVHRCPTRGGAQEEEEGHGGSAAFGGLLSTPAFSTHGSCPARWMEADIAAHGSPMLYCCPGFWNGMSNFWQGSHECCHDETSSSILNLLLTNSVEE